MDPLNIVLHALESHGFPYKRIGDDHRSQCPVCQSDRQGRKDKLSTRLGDCGVLLHCFGDCPHDEICEALGLEVPQLFPNDGFTTTSKKNGQPHKTYMTPNEAITAILGWNNIREKTHDWKYLDAKGEHVLTVVRLNQTDGEKTYRPISKLPDGKWCLKAIPSEAPLYRLDTLVDADHVWVFEGEKTADAGCSIGLTGTCHSGGSGAAKKTDWSPLAGKPRVTISPDTGETGEKRCREVLAELHKLNPPPQLIDVCRLDLDGSNKDLDDWLEKHDAVEPQTLREVLMDKCQATGSIDNNVTEDSKRKNAGVIRTISYRLAADIEAEPVEWLWYGYIPQTGITFYDGSPEVGKTTVAMDIIARLTQGLVMPNDPQWGDEVREGMNVAILAKEDRYENTIKPRLMAADANMNRVMCMDDIAVTSDSGKALGTEFIVLPDHTETIVNFLTATDAKLLLIDPFDNHLADGLNTNSNTDMRKAFMPLIEGAGKLNCTLLVIRHFGKHEYSDAKHKGLGSIALTGMARCVLGSVPGDSPAEFVFGRIKGNLSKKPTSLTYQIMSWDQDSEIPKIKWLGATDEDISQRATEKRQDGKRTKTDQAIGIMEGMLTLGPQPQEACEQACYGAGISKGTINRARQKAPHIKARKMGFGDGWELFLEAPEKPDDDEDNDGHTEEDNQP